MRSRWLGAGLALLVGSQAAATEVVLALDDGAAPLADVVASLHAEAATTAGAQAVMDQRDSEFVPGVLPVQVGTAVSFPNSDKVRHQVYSFSPAGPFELPLYAGTPAAPVRFGTPGVVVVGCNIHDWMIGYIVVLDTPYFGKSGDDGALRLQVPPGRYTLRLWHPRLAGEAPERTLEVGEGGPLALSASLSLGPPPPPRRGSERLRALQQRLRAGDGGP